MHNLLADPIIRVRMTDGSQTSLSLPETLAGLSRSDIRAFSGLQPHQRHAWYAFLVQLAAIALVPRQTQESPTEADEWGELLRSLSPAYPDDSPWRLVVSELTHPAFLQPPVPEDTLKGFKNVYAFPDDIDILATAKSHDIKMRRIRAPELDHWVYALVTLQTLQGFSGNKLYGISRMNGGLGNRPCLSVIPNLEWGARFRRDLRVLRATRQDILAGHFEYRAEGGSALLWLAPWDGVTSLNLSELDPYYIEICRRVRAVLEEERLLIKTMPTSVTRIAAKEQKGIMGDPWTPIDVEKGKSLTISANGFRYDKLQQLLFTADFRPAACQKIYSEDPDTDLQVFAQGMVRGQGKTEGLHQRLVPIPAAARQLLSLDQGRDQLEQRAKAAVEDVAALMKSALRPALLNLVQAGAEKLNFKDRRTDAWQNAFTARIDEIFFVELWAGLESPDKEARESWRRSIEKIGANVLREAEDATPIPLARRYRALAMAERAYHRGVQKHFGKENLHGGEVDVG